MCQIAYSHIAELSREVDNLFYEAYMFLFHFKCSKMGVIFSVYLCDKVFIVRVGKNIISDWLSY